MKMNEKRKVIHYKFWGYTTTEPWSDFDKGVWMLAVIVAFPLWIWFYIGYKILQAVGRMDGKPKEEVTYEEDTTTYY
jgi:hypothetical protein